MIAEWTWTDVTLFAALVALGALLKFGALRVMGRRVVIPYIDRSATTFTVLVIVATVLSLVTVIQTQANGNLAESCAVQFRDALTYNASQNGQEKTLRDERDAQFDKLLGEIVMNAGKPAEQSRADNGLAITQYRARVGAIDRERDAAAASRIPYPDPTCGRR